MVVTPLNHQRLSPRGDPEVNRNGEWGIPQIITPAILGVVLLLFVACILWQRRTHGSQRSYNYQQIRSNLATKIERMFAPRRKRQQVLRPSAIVTLEDSMRTSRFTFDSDRRSRQFRSDSSDSQTPLTAVGYGFDYPPDCTRTTLSESPPPIPKRPRVRWWWLFGSRPQQIKSEEPGQRWRVDDPDGSSSEHGHSNNGHRGVRTLEPLHEDPGDDVICIGENFSVVASTPMTQHFPEQASTIRGMMTVPERPRSPGTHTPVLTASSLQSNSGTPQPSADRGLPPTYDISQSHVRSMSPAGSTRPARSGPYMPFSPPACEAGYSPRAFHGRELSSDSILATQPPMVVPSMY